MSLFHVSFEIMQFYFLIGSKIATKGVTTLTRTPRQPQEIPAFFLGQD